MEGANRSPARSSKYGRYTYTSLPEVCVSAAAALGAAIRAAGSVVWLFVIGLPCSCHKQQQSQLLHLPEVCGDVAVVFVAAC